MAIKKQVRHKGPALAWRRPKDLNELWEAVAPGGGRYVIRMIGAYRTGAPRYEVNLKGASYHSAYLNHFKTATMAKRVAGAHANRLAVLLRAGAVGPTTRGPWDPDGGKRRRSPSSAGGWTKVKPGGIKEFSNAIWQRRLPDGLRAIIETAISLDNPLAKHSKVEVWIVRGKTAIPAGMSVPRGPYWNVEDAKTRVNASYRVLRHKMGSKKLNVTPSRLGILVSDINKLTR